MNKEKITGVILAGGKNSRMGSDKGLLKVDGKNIMERIIEELKIVTGEIIIISNGRKYDYLGYKVYPDIFKDCGPMGGIHTALTYSQTEKNIIISCDMPFVTRNILKIIIEKSHQCAIAIPEHHDEELEPLCAIYSKSCTDKFKKLLQNGNWKMKDALAHFEIKKIDFTKLELPENNFLNINTPEEYQAIKRSQHEYSS